MKFEVPVRVTRARKCREGFYVVINSKRLRYATRALALEEVRGFLALQRIQVCTVREFAERNAAKIKQQMPQPQAFVVITRSNPGVKGCNYLVPTPHRVSNSHIGVRECGETASWRRIWNGGERFYCDAHMLIVRNVAAGKWKEVHHEI